MNKIPIINQSTSVAKVGQFRKSPTIFVDAFRNIFSTLVIQVVFDYERYQVCQQGGVYAD